MCILRGLFYIWLPLCLLVTFPGVVSPVARNKVTVYPVKSRDHILCQTCGSCVALDRFGRTSQQLFNTATTQTAEVQRDQRACITAAAMALPPERINIKRRREEEPVETLCMDTIFSFSHLLRFSFATRPGSH